MTQDRGADFDGVRIGRPATGALVDAGYAGLGDLPADLSTLLDLHGVGPRAVDLLGQARARGGRPTHRIFTTSVASVHPHYVTKLERKGRTRAELEQAIEWLTGFDADAQAAHLAAGTTFEGFFAAADLNPRAGLITGVVCGVRVEDVDDPLMQQIRWLDKLVDELARGKTLEKVLR